jgi:HEAT repeat protein
MLEGSKRLLILLGVGAALFVFLLVAHVIPWLTADETEEALDELIEMVESETPGKAGDPPPEAGTSGGAYAGSRGTSKSQVLPRLKRIAHRPRAEHLPVLKAAARSPHAAVRQTAVSGIGRLGTSADPGVLMSALRGDPSAEVRAAAAAALGRIKCWDAGEILMDALSDPEERVRARAGAALQQIMGVDFLYRAKDPQRDHAIQKIRSWWPKYYEGHRQRSGKG